MDSYRNDPAVRQLIIVQAVHSGEAQLLLYEKSEVEGSSVWTETLRCEALIGVNGLGKTKEGDGKTPVGDFGILTAFGIKPDPGTALPYLQVDENTYCCGDAAYYNQLIDAKALHHDCTGEHLIDYSPEYNYGIFLDYNKERTPGKGSAIFLHGMGAKPYTAGCVAVSEENMVTILKSLQSGARLIIANPGESGAK